MQFHYRLLVVSHIQLSIMNIIIEVDYSVYLLHTSSTYLNDLVCCSLKLSKVCQLSPTRLLYKQTVLLLIAKTD